MVKRALLIGINYKNTPDQLDGCINDVNNIRNFLTSKLGFTNFMVLTDDTEIKPTRKNILKAFDIFVNSLIPGDVGWLYYSGHGVLQRDFNRDEVSGYDSCIVPIDYNVSGSGNITDDIIRRNLTQRVRKGVKLYIVLDACNNGTGCDNRFKLTDSSFYYDKDAKSYPTTYIPSEWTLQQTVTEFKKYPRTLGEIYTISGCEDDQYSADTSNGGALTNALLELFVSNDLTKYKWKHFLKDLSCFLKIYGYDQQPTITSGQPINIENSIFEPLKKIKINTNLNKKKFRYMNINHNNNFLLKF